MYTHWQTRSVVIIRISTDRNGTRIFLQFIQYGQITKRLFFKQSLVLEEIPNKIAHVKLCIIL